MLYTIIGGEIAAIVMGFVALLTIILFAILFIRKRKARQQSQMGRLSPSGNVLLSESAYFGGEKAKASTDVHAVESNHYNLNNEGNSAKVDHSKSKHFWGDVNASSAASNHNDNFNSTNSDKERIQTPHSEVHVVDGIANPNVESEDQFHF